MGQQRWSQCCAHKLAYAGLILRHEEEGPSKRIQGSESGDPSIHILQHGKLFGAVAGVTSRQLAELCGEAILYVQGFGIALSRLLLLQWLHLVNVQPWCQGQSC